MKNILIYVFALLFSFSHTFASEKVYTIGERVGIVADDQEWVCEVISIDDSGLVGKDYGTLFIQGKSKNHPVSFDFFYTIQHKKQGDWNKTPSHFTFVLQNYVNCMDTVLSNLKIKQNSHGKIVVEGDYLDNYSVGYFQQFSESKGKGDNEKVWFNMIIKVESDCMDEETLQFYYDMAKVLKKNLY